MYVASQGCSHADTLADRLSYLFVMQMSKCLTLM